MHRKVILSWVSFLVLIATSAHVSVPASANTISSVSGVADSAGSRESIIQSLPEVQRVGFVVAYVPGQSITIVDRAGNQFTYELASPLKILPAFRSNGLGPGAFVTVIAPNNVPGGKHMAVGIVVHSIAPPSFPTPPPPVGPSGPTTPGTPPSGPSVPTEDKPSTFPPASVPLPPLPPLEPGIGYSLPADFPDWTMPIRVAVFTDIIIDPAQAFTPVGIVEIGSDPLSPRIYLVAIDLVSTGAEVQGQLSSLTSTDTLDVTFQRLPQILNPERTSSPYAEFQTLAPAPTTFSSIFADGVCFIATTADGPTKFCSSPSGPAEPASSLSAMDNFPSQYASLQDLIIVVAQQFGLLDVIQLDQIISMQEDVQHILDCASTLTQQACGADVVVAPVSGQYFEQKYNEKFGDVDDDDDDDDDEDDESNLGPTAFDVAVMKVLRPIETSAGTVQPGDYRMDYWFDSNGVFYAATLTGVTTTNTTVVNQQIPAVPAVFMNADGTDLPGAHISACRIFRHCVFFQGRCG